MQAVNNIRQKWISFVIKKDLASVEIAKWHVLEGIDAMISLLKVFPDIVRAFRAIDFEYMESHSKSELEDDVLKLIKAHRDIFIAFDIHAFIDEYSKLYDSIIKSYSVEDLDGKLGALKAQIERFNGNYSEAMMSDKLPVVQDFRKIIELYQAVLAKIYITPCPNIISGHERSLFFQMTFGNLFKVTKLREFAFSSKFKKFLRSFMFIYDGEQVGFICNNKDKDLNSLKCYVNESFKAMGLDYDVFDGIKESESEMTSGIIVVDYITASNKYINGIDKDSAKDYSLTSILSNGKIVELSR